MPIIPLKQNIQVERGSELDVWGNTIPENTIPFKCRVDEGSFLIQSKSTGVVTSKEVVASARIVLDGLADIRYEDSVSYTNELGHKIKRSPKKIEVKRMFNGKPMMTVVFL
jgi:hypothetical protein